MQCWLLGSRRHGWAVLTVPGCFVLGRREVSDLTVKPGGDSCWDALPWWGFIEVATSGPRQGGHRSRAYRSAGAESGRAAPAYRQGTRGGYFAEGQAPICSVLGFRPSQKSQVSPNWRQPWALGCSSPICLRCWRQSTARIVTAEPSLLVPSHKIIRNCGCGFIYPMPSVLLLRNTRSSLVSRWSDPGLSV
jgi:hypothetical protein